ncbi:LamG domain-containing protein [uncultured Streptomyces sp.]|uniref:LamG domain-containing protein n=1 Tax=uncultured Streptomyces sp. TaxID=174707 RepID=UPI00261F2E03|nr:LamG domain-containing protein [uncultured Streptomyces sp.]
MNGARTRASRRVLLRLAAAGAATAVVLGTAGTAHAAENLPPSRPLVQDLLTDTSACGAGDLRTYVGGAPTLRATLYDPAEDDQEAEGNWVGGEFELRWTDADGVEQRRSRSVPATLSGHAGQWATPADVPADTVVSWHVRADDGTAVSAWSSEDGGSACEFVIDDEIPAAPAVGSPDYPTTGWSDGVGVYGEFTVDSASDDVVGYSYSFKGGTPVTVRPEVPGGPVTVRHLPLKAGPETLSVRAVDRAGWSSPTTTYDFAVAEGRGPVAAWALADPAGAGTAVPQTGPAARAGAGVTFGAAAPAGRPNATAAAFDGGPGAFLTPDTPVADPDRTFAVSAWARPGRTDRTMTVASQGGSAGLVLGQLKQDGVAVWSFTVGGARVFGGTPETGKWAHLVGLYDATTGRARLYVDGHEVGTPVDAVPAGGAGDFQIGRIRQGALSGAPWSGGLSEIHVYDRVVVAPEAAALARREPTLLGSWSLDTAADGVSPDRTGRAPFTLAPGATLYTGSDGSCDPWLDPECPYVPEPLTGAGHLQLDGVTGHATTREAVVDTADSFTLGVTVRLTGTPDRPMTVLSQRGAHGDAFKVRYDPASHAWQLVMAGNGATGTPETVVSHVVADAGRSHRLAVVHDDASDLITLHVDGNTAASAPLRNGSASTGALQIGRGTVGGGWGEQLRGDVDEVRAYAGVLSDQQIAVLGRSSDT